MSLGLFFWICMLIWIIAGFVPAPNRTWPIIGSNLLLFAVIAALGWKVFGPPIQ